MEQFVEQLMAEQGIPEDLDPEVRKQLKLDLLERLSRLINKRLVDALSDEDVESFNRMLDGDANDEALQAFISEHVADQQQVIGDAMAEFRKLYLGVEVEE